MNLFELSGRIERAIRCVKHDLQIKNSYNHIGFTYTKNAQTVDDRRLDLRSSLYRRASEYDVNPEHLMVILGITERERKKNVEYMAQTQ